MNKKITIVFVMLAFGTLLMSGCLSRDASRTFIISDMNTVVDSNNYVDLNTNQTIAGNKTFTGETTFDDNVFVNGADLNLGYSRYSTIGGRLLGVKEIQLFGGSPIMGSGQGFLTISSTGAASADYRLEIGAFTGTSKLMLGGNDITLTGASNISLTGGGITATGGMVSPEAFTTNEKTIYKLSQVTDIDTTSTGATLLYECPDTEFCIPYIIQIYTASANNLTVLPKMSFGFNAAAYNDWRADGTINAQTPLKAVNLFPSDNTEYSYSYEDDFYLNINTASTATDHKVGAAVWGYIV